MHRQIKNSGGCFLLNAPRGALVFQAEKLKEFPTGNLNFLLNEVRVVPVFQPKILKAFLTGNLIKCLS